MCGVVSDLNGHDHCNQHITDAGIHYFTSGTAENKDPSTNHSGFNKKYNSTAKLMWHNPSHNGGFASVRITKEALHFTQHNGDGSAIYSTPPIAPRRNVYVGAEVEI